MEQGVVNFSTTLRFIEWIPSTIIMVITTTAAVTGNFGENIRHGRVVVFHNRNLVVGDTLNGKRASALINAAGRNFVTALPSKLALDIETFKRVCACSETKDFDKINFT